MPIKNPFLTSQVSRSALLQLNVVGSAIRHCANNNFYNGPKAISKMSPVHQRASSTYAVIEGRTKTSPLQSIEVPQLVGTDLAYYLVNPLKGLLFRCESSRTLSPCLSRCGEIHSELSTFW